jgi:hypothetical protein
MLNMPWTFVVVFIAIIVVLIAFAVIAFTSHRHSS